MQVVRPYNPVEDELETNEELEASYEVSTPVPSCAMWNLLNNQRGRHAIVVDRGLAQVCGRQVEHRSSGADEHHGKDLATSALGRRLSTEYVLGMEVIAPRASDLERELHCDDHCDRSRIQSSELREEMRSDVEALTVRLQEANEQVCELKARMISVKRLLWQTKRGVIAKWRSSRARRTKQSSQWRELRNRAQ
jgi:hypothetical protein